MQRSGPFFHRNLGIVLNSHKALCLIVRTKLRPREHMDNSKIHANGQLAKIPTNILHRCFFPSLRSTL